MKTIKLFAIGAAVIGAFCFGKSMATGNHPEMMAAKEKLESAKINLQKAAHDYSGHRAKAIEHVDLAIKEINDGITSVK